METRTKNARVVLCDASTGTILPVMTLTGSLVLARMAQPGPMTLVVETAERTRVSATLDGKPVLDDPIILAPGRHQLSSPALVFRPSSPLPVAAAAVADPDGDRQFLQALGVEPDFVPAFEDKPYIGAAGGVLSVRLGYYQQDNGQEYEQDIDVVVIKLNAGDDFDRAVAANAHRIRFTPDPDAASHPPLCATCNLTRPKI